MPVTRRRTVRRRRNPAAAARSLLDALRDAERAMERAVYAYSDLQDELSGEGVSATGKMHGFKSDLSRLARGVEDAGYAAQEIAENAASMLEEREERSNPRRRNGGAYATGPVMEAALVNAKKAVTIMSKDDVALDLFRPAAEARTALNQMVLTRRRLKKMGTGFSVSDAPYNEIVAVFHAVASHLPASSKAKTLLLAIPVSR